MGRKKITDEQKKANKSAYMKKYHAENVEESKVRLKKFKLDNPDYYKQWTLDNKEDVKEYHKRWHQNNKEKVNNASKCWVNNNKEKLNTQTQQRKQNDPLYKLSCNIRSLIANSFSSKSYKKQSKTTDILGCSFEQFKQYLESQFESWMTWDNRGTRTVLGPNTTWDLDHIIPINSTINEDDIKRLNHYTNFQPLCSYQNRFIKKDKI
jgi:hypothetical protein